MGGEGEGLFSLRHEPVCTSHPLVLEGPGVSGGDMEGSSSQASCRGASLFRAAERAGGRFLARCCVGGCGPLEPGPQHRPWVGPALPLAHQGGRGAETRPPEATGVPLLWVAHPCGSVSTSFLSLRASSASTRSPGLAIILDWFTLQSRPPAPPPQQEPEESAGSVGSLWQGWDRVACTQGRAASLGGQWPEEGGGRVPTLQEGA